MVVEAEWARVVSAQCTASKSLASDRGSPRTGSSTAALPGGLCTDLHASGNGRLLRMHGGQVVMSRIVAVVVLVPVMLVPVMFAPAVPAGGAPRSVPHGTTGTFLPALPPAAPGGAWAWPLPQPHTMTRPFEAPQTQYSAGHRGIDIAAAAGTRVYAAADGVVSFAGVVAGRPLLSIAHPGELVSSIEPVQALVANGEHVSVGQQVGLVAVGGHCSNACLHLGVRLHGQYVSPLLLLGGIPRAVLLPLGGD
jgi:hypothetical protein